jgi:hypothetical protein
MLSADSVIPNARGTQGYNPYAYAVGNPTTWTDPTGHQAIVPAATVDLGFKAFLAVAAASLPIPLVLPQLWPIILVVLEVIAFVLLVMAALLVVFFVADLLSKAEVDFGSPGGEPTSDEQIKNAPDNAPRPVPPIPWNLQKTRPTIGQTVYRVYGGEARENGLWWTPLDPHRLKPYGDYAELPRPPRNTCVSLVSGPLLTEDVEVQVKENGFVEYIIANPTTQVGQPRSHEVLNPAEFCGALWAA